MKLSKMQRLVLIVLAIYSWQAQSVILAVHVLGLWLIFVSVVRPLARMMVPENKRRRRP